MLLTNPRGGNHFLLVPSAQPQAAPAYREHKRITEKPRCLWGSYRLGGIITLPFIALCFEAARLLLFSSLHCNLHCSVTLGQNELLVLPHEKYPVSGRELRTERGERKRRDEHELPF